MEQLSGLDALFTLGESRNAPMHIGALMLYEPVGSTRQPLQFEQVCRVFADNLGNSPVFRRKLVTVPYRADRPYWADDRRFDLDNHLDAWSAEGLRSPQELWHWVSERHAQCLNMKRPLWRASFIEDLDAIEGYAPGTTGLYIKVHHAAIDGMSGAAILAALHSLTDGGEPDDGQAEPWRAKRATPGWWLASKANSTSWMRSFRNVARAREIGRNIMRLREHLGAPGRERPHNQWTPSPFNAGVDAQRNIAVLNMPFDDIKAVKRSVNSATVNHVALCIVGGAMRRYLLQHEALPEISLSSAVPIDVRNPADEHGGNVLTATITALRTDIANPLERLSAVRDAAIEARESASVLGETTLLELSSVLSQRTSQALLRTLSTIGKLPFNKPMPLNTVVSNVPGSPLDLYLGGARMTNMHAFGLLMDGMALFHTATSYKDCFSITALSCPSRVPDIEFYQRCLEESWQELREATLGCEQPRGPSDSHELPEVTLAGLDTHGRSTPDPTTARYQAGS